MIDLARWALSPFGGRFVVVGYLPAVTAVAFLLTLVWAGAPGGGLSLPRAWHTALDVQPLEAVLMALGTLLVAVLLQPALLAVVRCLQGGWPVLLGGGLGRRRQLRRYAAHRPPAEVAPEAAVDGAAVLRFLRRFPDREQDVRSTALGNAMAAVETRVGRGYGIDGPVAWPRLYPLLRPDVRTVVDDRRNSLDLNARLCATSLVLSVVTAVLLGRSGWWWLVTVVPVALAVGAYHAAVRAAIAYGEAVAVAIDLQRFDLLTALHLPLPADAAAERVVFRNLCALWRQNAPVPFVYHHETDPAGSPFGPPPDGRVVPAPRSVQ